VLSDAGAHLLEQGAQQMHLGAVLPPRAAKRLAVHGDGLIGRRHAHHPFPEGPIHGLRIGRLQHPAHRGLGGRLEALGLGVEARPQALELGLGQASHPLGNRRIAPAAGEHRGETQGQHAGEGVAQA